MAVVGLEVSSRQTYADGVAFGDVGPYEQLDGQLLLAVDPAEPANHSIVDLGLAPRGPDGRVHFRADFCLLQPAEAGRGNGRLLLEVPNRGRRLVQSHFNRAPFQAAPEPRIDPGDGFVFRQGWSVAWVGSQWDVFRSAALMGLEAPSALDAAGRPIQGPVICEFQPNAPIAEKLLANRLHQPYPAADPRDPQAMLSVRDWPDGPRSVIPRARWRFARDQRGEPVENDSYVWLEGGFEPGRLYEVVYRTRICPVVGTGLLAVRDAAAFLRHAGTADGNPCAGRLERIYAFGISQSARFLRHFLYLGLNLDEAGRQVFDAVWAHVGGERRGEFNQRFGQPSVQSTPGFGHLPPFASSATDDLPGGATSGLLDRQQALGGVPKLLQTNTAAEYWRGGGSLIHTSLDGQRDLEPGTDERIYLFSGCQHLPGVFPLTDTNPNDGSRGAHPFSALDFTPLLRAMLVNLDQWVSRGEPPPASAFPRLADGTAIRPAQALASLPRLPGASMPALDRLPRLRRVDVGPDAASGVGRFPAEQGEAYPNYVSALDGNGNELAGLRLPDLLAPLATYTAWNTRHPATGGPGQLIPMMGSTFPFAASAEQQQHQDDPRPSLAERYRDRDDYLAQLRAEAERLVGERVLLAEDVEHIVSSAATRYDAWSG